MKVRQPEREWLRNLLAKVFKVSPHLSKTRHLLQVNPPPGLFAERAELAMVRDFAVHND